MTQAQDKARTARDAHMMRLASAASIAVALILIILKIWAWLATDSVALLSSLADSLLDLIASLITFFAVKVALEPADREHRFGHGKSEGVAGIAQAVIISVSAGFVGIRAIYRLVSPAELGAPEIGIGVMIVSLALTLGLVAVQRYVVAQTGSLAINADAAHYRADILTNMAVIVALVVSTRLGWLWADPILALLIVALILWSVRDIAKQALDELLDREFPTEDRRSIERIAHQHSAVLGVHDIRTRTAGAMQFIQFHLELEKTLTLDDVHAICDEVELEVKRAFPAAEVLIHADPYGVDERRDRF